MTLNDEQELQIWRDQVVFGRQYRKGAIKMSLDHEDIERVENIEDKISIIEQRLDKMDEARQKQLQNINEQMAETIDKLPMGVRGMMKKILKGTTPEELENENGGEKDV